MAKYEVVVTVVVCQCGSHGTGRVVARSMTAMPVGTRLHDKRYVHDMCQEPFSLNPKSRHTQSP